MPADRRTGKVEAESKPPIILVILSFFFPGAEDWTQGLALATKLNPQPPNNSYDWERYVLEAPPGQTR